MDDLLAEINRKRSYVESTCDLASSNRKFFKQSDLAEKERQAYLNKRLEGSKKCSLDKDFAVPPQKESLEQIAEKTEKIQLTSNEIINRLRKRGQPIKLFGETELMTYQRLRKLELVEPEESEGSKNDMKILMEKMENESNSNIAKDSSSTETYNVKVKPTGVTFIELAKQGLEITQHDWKYDAGVVHKFCQLMLQLWGEDLNSRHLDVKKCQQGRLEAARFLQTVDYLKPLIRKLKSETLEEEMLDSLANVVYWSLKKEYVQANDSYLQMAIGNAPWPIGVTMHGIHARPGKDKLATKTIAHVLNDEQQRKYVQAFKRLITFCQKLYPTDPSKSVEFNA